METVLQLAQAPDLRGGRPIFVVVIGVELVVGAGVLIQARDGELRLERRWVIVWVRRGGGGGGELLLLGDELAYRLFRVSDALRELLRLIGHRKNSDKNSEKKKKKKDEPTSVNIR
jgi:hypothetical protein